MRKSGIITLSVMLLAGAYILLLSSGDAQARKRGFVSIGGEKIVKVKDLPDKDEFKHPQYGYVDLGYKIKQITVVFLPLWNYSGEYVGYIGRDDKYLILPPDVIANIEKEGINLSKAPSLPFWDKMGGKLIIGFILLILAGVGIFWVMQKKEDEPEVSENDNPPPPAAQ
ncbi:MAG: hypothetical protein JXR95_15505 [Deltaproteobacteria bacterium]|nr:hypothetical protein [Deltaproteobacteria bacterium]